MLKFVSAERIRDTFLGKANYNMHCNQTGCERSGKVLLDISKACIIHMMIKLGGASDCHSHQTPPDVWHQV